MTTTLKGTTLSGSAVKTTLMNTLNSVMYMKFISQKAKVDTRVFAAGDDVLLMMPTLSFKKFAKTFWTYYTKPKEAVIRGLGQAAKRIDASTTEFEFLSRCGAVRNGHLYWIRSPERVNLTAKTTTALK